MFSLILRLVPVPPEKSGFAQDVAREMHVMTRNSTAVLFFILDSNSNDLSSTPIYYRLANSESLAETHLAGYLVRFIAKIPVKIGEFVIV